MIIDYIIETFIHIVTMNKKYILVRVLVHTEVAQQN